MKDPRQIVADVIAIVVLLGLAVAVSHSMLKPDTKTCTTDEIERCALPGGTLHSCVKTNDVINCVVVLPK